MWPNFPVEVHHRITAVAQHTAGYWVRVYRYEKSVWGPVEIGDSWIKAMILNPLSFGSVSSRLCVCYHWIAKDLNLNLYRVSNSFGSCSGMLKLGKNYEENSFLVLLLSTLYILPVNFGAPPCSSFCKFSKKKWTKCGPHDPFSTWGWVHYFIS